ncbi:MAG TPA: acetylxylan esterase, partial [Sphingobacteriaceae bacterium]
MNLPNIKTYQPIASQLKMWTLAFAMFFCGMPLANAQKKALDIIKGLMRFSDAPNSLYHEISKTAYQHLNDRSEKVQAIKSLDEWKSRQAVVRQALAEVMGKFPDRTPLNAVITKTIQKDGYRIEHIVYESQPQFYVTSSLFIPDKAVKAPAVIYCSGHSESGYRFYQNIIVSLVKKGFVVFAFDPVGQGERLQYYNAEKKRSEFIYPAFEHSYVGAQLFISGNSLANVMTWDGIRAVDYLLSRKEVDAARIGITGRSGGGTQSAYIAAMDPRIKAVAPENYISDLTSMFETLGPQDAEQIFLHGVIKGLDMADLLAVRAPKPALLIATT